MGMPLIVSFDVGVFIVCLFGLLLYIKLDHQPSEERPQGP